MSKETARELLRQDNEEAYAYYDDADLTEAQFAKKHRDAVAKRLTCRPDEAETVCREMHKIMAEQASVSPGLTTGNDTSSMD